MKAGSALLLIASAARLAAQPDARALIPLYESAVERAADKPAAFADLGLYLRGIGERERAAGAFRRAVAIEASPAALERLASVVSDAEAVPLLERAARGGDAPVASRCAARLADLTGEIEWSRLALDKAAPGSIESAVRMNDLALLAGPREGVPLLRRAQAIQRGKLGERHPETATTLTNLGNLLLAAGRPVEAESLLRRAMAVFEATLGPDHPRLGAAASGLADVLRLKGDFAGAKTLYERTLAIDIAAYGDGHPEVEADRRNLSELAAEAAAARRSKR